MIRAVASLARHRLAGRSGATLLLIAAVAAAMGLTGTIRALGLGATDTAVREALLALSPSDQALRITGYAPSSALATELDAVAVDVAGQVSAWASRPVAGAIFRRVRDPLAPYDLQLVAVDDVGTAIRLADGALPATCDKRSCEAVLLASGPAPADLPSTLHVGDLEIRLVGRGTLDAANPFGNLDERGPRPPSADPTAQETDPPPALLLVQGVAATAQAPGAANVGRQYVWTAALDVDAVHPWTVDALEASLDAARRALATRAPSLTLSAPSEAIAAELRRGASNEGRLLLVGALGVAILVVFAGYSALLGRRDLRAELDRLAAAGATRAAGTLLVCVEVLVPTAIGSVAGWAAAAVAARLAAAGASSDPGGVAFHALLDPASLAVGGAVLIGASVAILAGLLGFARREALAGLLPGGLLVTLLVAWRAIAGGGLDAGALGRIVDAPVLALVPVLLGTAVTAVSLALVPPIFRRLARGGQSRAVSVRLALLSLARDPVRPAATITLLAFGIGGLVFAVADAATLRRGMADQAAFATGMDLGVVEAGSGLTRSATVVPLDRYGTLGGGVETYPVVHVPADAGPAGTVTVLGLPPGALPRLRGWRDDLGADPASLGKSLAVEGPFEVPGVRLAPAAKSVAVTVTHAGDPVYLSVVVAGDDGDAGRIFLGTLRPGRSTLEAPLPTGMTGARIIGLIVSEGRLISGADHLAGLARATLVFEGLDPVVGSRPVTVEVSGLRVAVLRAPLATDSLILPAIVGPQLGRAAAATPGGVLSLRLGDADLARIRVVAILPRFPGMPEAGPDFAVVALDPLLVAMDGASPGAGRPDAAWLRVDDPARIPAIRAALADAPFRSAAVRSRTEIEAAAAADPFTISVLAGFAAAGASGLLLAALGLAMGALANLRDETGELRDLEAQGVGPRSLRRQVQVRTLLLAAGGAAAGLVMGVGLAAAVTAVVGVGADLRAPVPALRLELPWPAILAASVGPLLAAALLGAVATGGAFRASARTRDRA